MLVVAAVSPVARAEGGLPGSPRAVTETAPVASPLPQGGGASMAGPDAATENPGGAIFSPFADPSTAKVSRPDQASHSSDSRASDYSLALMVSAVGVAAIAWLLLKAV
ncbi:hypothetical protein [Variovorax fucosicus]|uniref:hypothetical protein n=1 Tax=Variovorax fucosicus TaxID=3053517 RepID=UPI00257817FB|nr:hypothetical protein [Variovorax sp. J22G47]MDM0056098.1 hypothetical protein [Variovorax sp. J22G47]